MIASLTVQHLQGLDRLLKGLPLAGFVDVVVIEGEVRVVAFLDGFCDVAHQSVEGLGVLYEADGKDKLRILFVFTWTVTLCWANMSPVRNRSWSASPR